ncbi:MAG: hypothetical protein BroJett013_07010 [Alphaproteobacteria bacterium]|nr:MAG: hypothetical protein BroJett013_07010 [Alphaproteobacteria bacterium]
MTFDPAWFGSKAEHVTLHQAQAEAERQRLEEAKDIIIKRLMITTGDHNGRPISA